MNVERLQQVIRVLKKVDAKIKSGKLEPSKFDMGTWYSGCSTAACACGWAMQDKWFKAQGFKPACYAGFPTHIDEDGFSLCGWAAVMSFFGLTENQAHFLFDDCRYTNHDVRPLDVVERLEHFISVF